MSLTSTFIISPNKHHQPSSRSILHISAVHVVKPSNNPILSEKTGKQSSSLKMSTSAMATASRTTVPSTNVGNGKWSVDSWKSKKALQLLEYPDKEELESVLRTLNAFPPIVFAGEDRSLEEKLAEAAMGNAFLL